MIYRILKESEIEVAAKQSRYVFDTCLRQRVNNEQTLSFVEDYLLPYQLKEKVQSGQLILWGAWNRNGLCAVSGMQRDGLITMLYVMPYMQNHKIGKELLTLMRSYAKNEWGYKRVSVNALPSDTSPYFARRGFYYVNEAGQKIDRPMQVGTEYSRYSTYMPMAARTLDRMQYTTRPIKDNVVAFMAVGFLVLIVVLLIIFGICVYFPK